MTRPCQTKPCPTKATALFVPIRSRALGMAVAVLAGGGSTADAFVFPGLLTIPAFLNIGSTTMFAIGTVLTVAIPDGGHRFTLTMVMGSPMSRRRRSSTPRPTGWPAMRATSSPSPPQVVALPP